jgi:hypothetical protein
MCPVTVDPDEIDLEVHKNKIECPWGVRLYAAKTKFEEVGARYENNVPLHTQQTERQHYH